MAGVYKMIARKETKANATLTLERVHHEHGMRDWEVRWLVVFENHDPTYNLAPIRFTYKTLRAARDAFDSVR